MQVRSTEVANGCREDIDTALLKLYAEQNHDSLLDLLASENACLLADSVPWLEKYHKCVSFVFFFQHIINCFRPASHCCDFNSSQQAMLYDMDLINLGTHTIFAVCRLHNENSN